MGMRAPAGKARLWWFAGSGSGRMSGGGSATSTGQTLLKGTFSIHVLCGACHV